MLLIVLLSVSLSADWNEYKSRFIQNDGRVIDKKNGNITHSEAIGYTLYFAYRFNDDKTFDKVYNWYKNNLHKNKYDLVSWKWGEKSHHKWGILDHNNATDGDLWIAYDLLLMAQKREDTQLKAEAFSLMEAIKEHLVVTYGGKLFLLPGKEGFKKREHIVLNPSYYRFDILEAFSTVEDTGPWRALARDGEWLLHQAVFSPLKLHSDWITIDENLTVKPAQNKIFGYDAIRIPLNIIQSNLSTKTTLLQSYKSYVNMMREGLLPLGTVNLEKGTISLYDYCYGHLAIYDKLATQPLFADKLKSMIEEDKDNYYAYTLYLFTTL